MLKIMYIVSFPLSKGAWEGGVGVRFVLVAGGMLIISIVLNGNSIVLLLNF